jgi:hypothetical protein
MREPILPPHEVAIFWCANCAAPAPFILTSRLIEPGVVFRTRRPQPCRRCGGLDMQTEKRVILTSDDRRFLKSLRILPTWAETVT